jgi:hypothetical protein
MRTETSRQTIAWLAQRARELTLQLAPPFQRKPVWLEREKAYLVDTVLRKLPVPEIYVHVVTSADGRTTYSIVDGQQRVTALLDFSQDKFPLDVETSPEWHDRRFSDFGSDIQQQFWAYSLVIRELHEASEADVRDLFQRLNRYVFALNAQELRNAKFKGEFIKTATELSDDEFWAANRIVTPNDIRRMLDIQFVSELVVGLLAGPQHKTDSLDDYYELYESDFGERAEFVRLFATTQSFLLDLVPDLPRAHWRKKSSFYSLFIVGAGMIRGGTARRMNVELAQRKLAALGDQIEAALSKEPPADLPDLVREYAVAVGRAASDRDRRLQRDAIIRSWLEEPTK